MRVCVLASGSRGNAVYIENRGTAIIVDQGLTHKQFLLRLATRDLDPSLIRGIIVSHEHSDHISGVGISARKLGIPVYATAGSFSKMESIFNGSEEKVIVESGKSFSVGHFEILPYSVPHDAVEPVQYCISSGKKRVAIATDIGFASTLVTERIKNVDILVIESNYDTEMLKKGPYPWQLKQRIMGKNGHLSNRNASELIFNLTQNNSTKIILAHLSEENNEPEVAERTVRELFDKYERCLDCLITAKQHEPTDIIEV